MAKLPRCQRHAKFVIRLGPAAQRDGERVADNKLLFALRRDQLDLALRRPSS
jgi:hypothetical protein